MQTHWEQHSLETHWEQHWEQHANSLGTTETLGTTPKAGARYCLSQWGTTHKSSDAKGQTIKKFECKCSRSLRITLGSFPTTVLTLNANAS